MNEEKSVVKEVKKQSPAEMEAEIKQLELEAARLLVKEKEANLQDLQERLADRELKREERRQRSANNGSTLRSLAATDAANQHRCNHRKGGNGAQGVVAGQGDDTNYAVMKHTFSNGDTWVRCLRCGRTWKPPVQEQYKTTEAYLAVVAEYQAALNFQTRNITSGSLQFRFSDGGKSYREAMKNTTLR